MCRVVQGQLLVQVIFSFITWRQQVSQAVAAILSVDPLALHGSSDRLDLLHPHEKTECGEQVLLNPEAWVVNTALRASKVVCS